jgi:hypothetical protein
MSNKRARKARQDRERPFSKRVQKQKRLIAELQISIGDELEVQQIATSLLVSNLAL